MQLLVPKADFTGEQLPDSLHATGDIVLPTPLISCSLGFTYTDNQDFSTKSAWWRLLSTTDQDVVITLDLIISEEFNKTAINSIAIKNIPTLIVNVATPYQWIQLAIFIYQKAVLNMRMYNAAITNANQDAILNSRF